MFLYLIARPVKKFIRAVAGQFAVAVALAPITGPLNRLLIDQGGAAEVGGVDEGRQRRPAREGHCASAAQGGAGCLDVKLYKVTHRSEWDSQGNA